MPCHCLAAQTLLSSCLAGLPNVWGCNLSVQLPGCLATEICGSVTSGCICAPCRDAQLLNAGAEIGLGFLTVLKLFTRDRNFILPFLVWCVCTVS